MKADNTFPRIMFAAPKSGSGKTLITCAFLEILKRRGIETVSFKCGPDYIDPLFHSCVTGIPAVNLDSFFLGREELTRLFERKIQRSHAAGCPDGREATAVIEGVMGYYDGIAGTAQAASSYDIADTLNCPVILILDMKGGDIRPEEILRVLLERVPETHIRGVILNRANPAQARDIRSMAGSLGLKFYGYVPEYDEAWVESRHLGLKLPADDKKFQEKISSFSDIIEKTTDIEGITELAGEAGEIPRTSCGDILSLSPFRTTDGTESGHYHGIIAVARDEAFCFVYEDNIDLLRELGYEVVYFSPLRDRALPSGAAAILLPGGYPEIYARELSSNAAMLRSVREAFGSVKILAECGGFMYLHESIEGADGNIYPMAGCIEARAYRTGRSQRFGYTSLYPRAGDGQKPSDPDSKDCLIKAHEFHYWDSTDPGSDLRAVKPGSLRSWDCCRLTPTLLAGFPHLYYRSGAAFIRSFLEGEAY